MKFISGLDMNFNQDCVRGLKIKVLQIKKVSTLKAITSAGTFSLS